MARGPRGAVLDEPPRTDRTEGAERSGAERPSLGSEVRHRGSLADPPGGGRQARRTRSERRRFWLVLMPGVAVALALVVAVGAVVRGDGGGAAAPARTVAPHRARASGTLLLGHRGADGRMDLLLLVGSQGSRSSVLMLPVATQLSRLFNSRHAASVYSRVETLMNSNTGLIGRAWSTLREAWFGARARRLILIQYESLARDPARVLGRLYEELGEPAFAHDFQQVAYDEPEYDRQLGLPGLHTVRPRVEFHKRESCLPPDLFAKYADASFWTRPELNRRQVTIL